MGGTAPKLFPQAGGLGQSQPPNVLNQSIAQPKLANVPLIGLSQMGQEPQLPGIQQPTKQPLGPNPMQNAFYGGANRSSFRPY